MKEIVTQPIATANACLLHVTTTTLDVDTIQGMVLRLMEYEVEVEAIILKEAADMILKEMVMNLKEADMILKEVVLITKEEDMTCTAGDMQGEVGEATMTVMVAEIPSMIETDKMTVMIAMDPTRIDTGTITTHMMILIGE